MKKFYGTLGQHATEMTDFRNKKLKSLTNEQQKSFQNEKNCYICAEGLKISMLKEYCKIRDHCHYTAEHRGAANLFPRFTG